MTLQLAGSPHLSHVKVTCMLRRGMSSWMVATEPSASGGAAAAASASLLDPSLLLASVRINKIAVGSAAPCARRLAWRQRYGCQGVTWNETCATNPPVDEYTCSAGLSSSSDAATAQPRLLTLRC